MVVDVRDDGGCRGGGGIGGAARAEGEGGGDDGDARTTNGAAAREVRCSEVSGIAASDMFAWNSIMIRAEEEEEDGGDDDADDDERGGGAGTRRRSTTDPLYVELVHIQSESCAVSAGDAVRRGQRICSSGSVGFSPEPHLHLAAYRSRDDGAATVPVRFECGADGRRGGGGGDEEGGGVRRKRSFLPRAGGWYDSGGIVRKGIK